MIYETIFNKLDKLTGGLQAFFLSGQDALRLKTAGYMDLVIEKLGNNTISMGSLQKTDYKVR